MLCRRPANRFEDTIKDFEGRPFIMEEKLDGERIQLHKRGNEYFYCSRLVYWFSYSTREAEINVSGKERTIHIYTGTMSEREVSRHISQRRLMIE